MWAPKCGSLSSAGKRQESATFLQRSFVNGAVQFFVRCSAAFGTMTSALQKANVAMQLLQGNFPKIAAQLLFSLVACCMVGLEVQQLQRVTSLGSLSSENAVDPRRAPQNPRREPRRGLCAPL